MNIIEALKANKGKILRGGLILLGTAAGIVLGCKFLVGKGHADEETTKVDTEGTPEEDEDEESDEEE